MDSYNHEMQTQHPFRMLWTLLLPLLGVLGGLAPLAQAADERDFFRTRVEPILVGRCLECHGMESRGGLDLRTEKSVRAGGDSGEVIVPGKPDDSLLYEFVATRKMPPKHPLSAEEVATLREWIERGAAFPDRTLDPFAFTTDKRAGYDWWSLQPIVRPAIPQVRAEDRVRTPIDAFVIARLEKSGLALSPEIDRATFLRRVMFDLHGLPPTYAEVRAFVEDERPDAYEKLIDRLLASPRYGERWGRHWLDVVRYAESNGFERDRIRTEFWRYRDWVIDAFNRDLPYDQFVREQLAADALHPDDPLALVATGFLAAGPKNDVDTISELERLTTRQDELDEFVVATGTTFLGLTVGCARCHDHKFDPITARDYYSLTAVFSGLDRANVPIAPLDVQTRYEQAVEAYKRRIDEAKRAQQALLDPVRERLAEQLAQELPAGSATAKLPAVRVERNEDRFEPVDARYIRLVIRKTSDGGQPCLDELEVYGAEAGRNIALAAAGAKAQASSLLPGYSIHQVAHLNDGKYGNSQSWISNEAGAGWAQIQLPQIMRVQRVVWGRDREARFADRLPIEYRIDISLDGQEWRAVSGSDRRVAYRPGTTPRDQVPLDQVLAALSAEQRATYDRLVAEIADADRDRKALSSLPVSYAVRDQAPREAWVLKRGNVRERGDPVDPAALAAVRSLAAGLAPAAGDSGPERRRRLAEWIVDSRNPLTARVMVNRIWHYHFGQGIVNTPSDFGFNGDRPSHPELLDWLAAELMAPTSGAPPQNAAWSLKSLHRLILLSGVYRQSSQGNPAGIARDGGNRLLWRMNSRRLESEMIRDAILQTSGELDPALGGPSFRLFEYRDGNVPDYVLLDKPGRNTWRRAVYMFNIRTFHEPLMSVFDCPDPSVQTPRREQSTTALQALSLMNNQFVFEQGMHFAERVRAGAGAAATSRNLAATAYRQALARDATVAELNRAEAFMQQTDLFSCCRVLLNSNEFLYVR